MSTNQPDLEKRGVEDELKGKGNQTAGWFQKTFGKLTGNRNTQAKGAVRELGGKVQVKGGQVEQKVEQKLEEHDQAQAAKEADRLENDATRP
jgi:uncharacterized protein YjbJ (UPF0337 family)